MEVWTYEGTISKQCRSRDLKPNFSFSIFINMSSLDFNESVYNTILHDFEDKIYFDIRDYLTNVTPYMVKVIDGETWTPMFNESQVNIANQMKRSVNVKYILQ